MTVRTYLLERTWSPVTVRGYNDYQAWLESRYTVKGEDMAIVKLIPKGKNSGETKVLKGRYSDIIVSQAKCFETVLIERETHRNSNEMTEYTKATYLIGDNLFIEEAWY